VSELVIGARRTGRQRRLRSLAIGALLVVLAALVSYLMYRRLVGYAEPSGSVPRRALATQIGEGDGAALTWGDCSLAHTGPIAVLTLVGGPHTLGACHGRLLGPEVATVAWPLSEAIEASAAADGILGRLLSGARLRWRYRMLDDGLSPAQLAEVAGLVRGAEAAGTSIDYEMLVRIQAAIDLGAAPPRAGGSGERTIARALSVALPVTEAGGARLVGRSVSLHGAGDGGDGARAPVVSWVHRDGVIPYASVGWPGLVGVVTGVNAEGIAVFVHPASASDVRPTRVAQPVALVAREVLENARSLDEAVGLVEKTPSLGAAGYLIVEGGGAVAWIERSPSRSRVVRGPSPVAYGDLFTTEPFTEDADNHRARQTRPSAARIARAVELARQAPAASAVEMAAILRDSAAVGGAALPLGHRGAIDDPSAVHTVIVDPAGLMLWVADGPGASGPLRAFDLRHALRGEPARSRIDVPADPARDPAAAHQVIAARADLRAARAARSAGERRRARELTARALARRPDLPEAQVLAGDLAREAGDIPVASAHYQRYLDLGPDDLAAAEQIRSFLRER
jgi:hypothetical protein